MRFLIIDDDPILQRMLGEILNPLAECIFANNGREGVDIFRKQMAEQTVLNLVIIDLTMPVFNGWHTREAIRNIENVYQTSEENRVKMMLISAITMEKKVFLLLDQTDEVHLLKPFNRKSVLKKIKRLKLLK
ncbi:MAG: response regulator [Nitrospinae bacterium]|nr:response regulator [Nitrospinota bacterium]